MKMTEIHHQEIASELFNQVQELLEKAERTPEDIDTMLHAAHACRFHWGQANAMDKLARSEWQISRVYAVLKRAEPSIYHARRCLELCQQNQISAIERAYAYEALARSYAVAGDFTSSRRFLDMAIEAGKKIKIEDKRNLIEKELRTIVINKPATQPRDG